MESPTADPALETLTVPEAAKLLKISDRHASADTCRELFTWAVAYESRNLFYWPG